MATVTLSHINKSFGSTRVVSDVSLTVAGGEFFSLLGPSGCGKSTLLRVIAGLEVADSGSVSVDGVPIDSTPPQKRGIGMVFQQYALWPHMTIAQNVRFGLETQALTNKERDARMERALDRVQMAQFKDRYPHQISGGQQQRVALARALAMQPSIILLDEPLSNLDARLRTEIRQELSELHQTLGTTMIYVTHDQEDALSLSSRMAIMNHGAIEQVGSPEDVYRNPTSCFTAQFIGDANLVPCSVVETIQPGLVKVRVPALQDATAIARMPGEHFKSDGHLCVRPSACTIMPCGNSPSPQVNSLDGTVVRSRYKGADYDLEIQVHQELLLKISCPTSVTRQAPAPGGAVKVLWAPEDSVYIPD